MVISCHDLGKIVSLPRLSAPPSSPEFEISAPALIRWFTWLECLLTLSRKLGKLKGPRGYTRSSQGNKIRIIWPVYYSLSDPLQDDLMLLQKTHGAWMNFHWSLFPENLKHELLCQMCLQIPSMPLRSVETYYQHYFWGIVRKTTIDSDQTATERSH